MTKRPQGDRTRNIVSKTIPILEAVATADEGIGVREVARRTGIDKSAVSRLFKQLEDLHVVEQSGSSGRFHVGSRLSALAAMVRDRGSLWREAEPLIRQLVDRFEETCYLVLRDGAQVRFKERIECRKTIRYVIEHDDTSPLHAGAAGRAILAGMTEDEVREYLAAGDIVRVTDKTIVDPDELLETSRRDRKQGYAASVGERVVGGAGVAAPFFRADGFCIGAVLWTCPAERFSPDALPDVSAALVAVAEKLSSRLGYGPPPSDE